MNDLSFLASAKIGKTHGLDGFLNITSLSGEVKHLEKLKEGKAELKDGRTVDLVVESVRLLSSSLQMKFAGYDTPEKARTLSGSVLYVHRKDASPLKKGEYYVADLFGLKLISEKIVVGTVIGVSEGSQALLLEIEKEDGKRSYIPNMKPFVGKPDFEKGVMELLEKDLLSL